ncbi:reverse transcriptase domain-containing protein [Tanacetum coccineum]
MDSEHPKNEDSEVPNTEEPRINQEHDANVNNTNNINIVSPTVNAVDIENNAADKNIVYGCIDDLNMPNLEEIVYSDDDEVVGAESDMNNLATTVPVSPIPSIRVHKDHPLEQIIGDIQSAPQTRRMTKSVTEHVEPKKVTQALIDPSWREAMQDELLYAKTVAPTLNSVIVQIDVDDNFVINSTHLKMIWENKFECYLRANPHDHIREFLAICNMFKYGETQSEAVKLLIFSFSLYDKAKTWFNELNEESITSWEQMRKAFINKFFQPSLFNRLLLEIRIFSQLVCESLIDAWLRLKIMLQKCHGHGLTKGTIIQIFYHGLDESTQGILDGTAGGIFLYKTPNQAFQFLEDKVLFNLDWPIKSKNEHHQKSVAFADSNSNKDIYQLKKKLKAMDS